MQLSFTQVKEYLKYLQWYELLSFDDQDRVYRKEKIEIIQREDRTYIKTSLNL